jgi:hypothetical protein
MANLTPLPTQNTAPEEAGSLRFTYFIAEILRLAAKTINIRLNLFLPSFPLRIEFISLYGFAFSLFGHASSYTLGMADRSVS